MYSLAIRPAAIVTMAGPIRRNQWIVARAGRIVFIGTDIPDEFAEAQRVALPNAILLPGFMNAHCHLEFGDLSEPIPADHSFANWISAVVHRRIQMASGDGVPLEELRRRAYLSSLKEAWQFGTRLIVDNVTAPWNREWLTNQASWGALNSDSSVRSSPVVPSSKLAPQSVLDAFYGQSGTVQSLPMHTIACGELIDINEKRHQETLESLSKLRSEIEHSGVEMLDWGIAPHAPYTASLNLVRQSAALAADSRRLCSLHLAESLDELDWVENRTGAFADRLAPFRGATFSETRGGIDEYCRAMAQSPIALIAHGNHLPKQSQLLLSSHASSMAIVHCPRTYRHFHPEEDCDRYPLRERVELGIRHLLGTDSRASNPDLNLWAEVREVFRSDPLLAPESCIAMITRDAAHFLNRKDLGTLVVGSKPWCNVMFVGKELPDRDSDVYRMLIEQVSFASPLDPLLI